MIIRVILTNVGSGSSLHNHARLRFKLNFIPGLSPIKYFVPVVQFQREKHAKLEALSSETATKIMLKIRGFLLI